MRAGVFRGLFFVLLSGAGLACWGQSSGSGTQQPAAAPSSAPAADQAAPSAAPGGHSQVLFSRSGDGKGATGAAATGTPSAVGVRAAAAKAIDSADGKAAGEEREAVSFAGYDLDIRIFAHQQSLAVRARLTLRNDGESALKQVRLQLSSTLKWERLQVGGKAVPFKSEVLRSDADHTGKVNEAVIDLAVPLEPGGVAAVDAIYSGPVALTGARLQDIGTPADVAQGSDWDEVSDDAVALRGFGDVIWYPVSAPPVALGDGAKYFTEVGRQKLRQAGALFKATITEEFVGEAPNLAVVNGRVEGVRVTAPPADSYPGVIACTAPETRLGFQLPSLFLVNRRETDGDDLQIYTTAESQDNAQNYLAGAALVDPLIHQWLGGRPKAPLAVVDLPQAEDLPFEAGAALFIGLGKAGGSDPAAHNTQNIAVILSHALSHAYFESPRAWLEEGVPQFVAHEWLAQTQGREAALEARESQRNALALVEPGSPGDGVGQSLIAASDTIYYRTKAEYVLGMLRDIAGDVAVSGALRAYVAAEDTRPDYFEGLVEKASGKDLRWFFDAWVYRDLGLPDLSIAKVFPTKSSEPGQYLVAVDVANEGYAEVEVPVTVRSKDASVTERVRVPGRGSITHRILLKGEPTEVELNDGSVPEVQATLHRQTVSVVKGN